MAGLGFQAAGGYRSSTGQRAPLLTDVEAPSVRVALGEEGGREGAKSGVGSAFVNMANSIM